MNQPIEGITPADLWTFMGVLLGLCLIYLTFTKVRAEIRKEREHKQLEQQPMATKIAKEVSKQVMEELQPRLSEIEQKLSNDKQRLDEHSRQINELNRQNNEMSKDIKALCLGVYALLNNAKGMSTEKEIDDAQKAFTGRLMEK